VLVTTEGVMRVARTQLSNDLVHIQEIPERIDRLSRGKGTRILFLGNSLTREGIDIEQFRREMESTAAVTVEQVYPDDTGIIEWVHVFEHFVTKRSSELDVVILGFAQTQLQDGGPINVRRLAHNYTDWKAATEIFREEDFSFDQRVEFTLARYSTAFANAGRVRKRIFDSTVPYYRTSAARVNTSIQSAGHAERQEQPTYRRLQKLIRLVQATEAKLVVVAYPVGKPYTLDAGLTELLDTIGGPWIDARNLPGITRDNFPDGYHMDASAAAIFTRHLATRL